MDQPLGRFSGNWVEVQECLELFRHFSPDFKFMLPLEKLRLSSDLLNLTHALTGQMLHLGGKAATAGEGATLSAKLLADGSAYRHFLQMVELQSDDCAAAIAAFDDPAAFHKPAATRTLTAGNTGYLAAMDCTKVGWAVQRLGAGRSRPGDPVSAHAGIEMHAKLGDRLEAGQPLATLFSEDVSLLDEPEQMLGETMQISRQPPAPVPLVREIITKPQSSD
jgi:pyrimidine-nucleoside phosphorylase